MKLRSLSFRGIKKRYVSPDPVTLDLDALPGQLIALVGPKGAGKTTLAEAIPASLFKVFPTRPDFYDCFSGRDAFIETVWADEAAREIRVRLTVDAERPTTESYITVDGQAVVNGKDAPFRAWIEEHFGSERSFLASVFACQKKTGSLIRMTKGERKATLGEWIGTDQYQALSVGAGAKATTAEADLNAERRLIAAVEVEVEALPVIEESLTNEEALRYSREDDVRVCRNYEQRCTEEAARSKTVTERLSTLEGAELSARRTLERAEASLSEAKAEPDRATKRHAERLKFIDRRTADERCRPLYDVHAQAVWRLDERRRRLEGQIAGLPDAEAVKADLAGVRRDIAVIEADDLAAQALLRDVDKATMELAAAQDSLDAARNARELEVKRLQTQAGLIAEVPCTAYQSWAPADPSTGDVDPAREDLAGTCKLLSNARAAKEQIATLEQAGPLPEEARVITAQAAVDGLKDRQATEAAEGPYRKDRHQALRLHAEQLAGDLARAEAGPQLTRDLDAVKTERQEVDRKLDVDLTASHEVGEPVLQLLRVGSLV